MSVRLSEQELKRLKVLAKEENAVPTTTISYEPIAWQLRVQLGIAF